MYVYCTRIFYSTKHIYKHCNTLLLYICIWSNKYMCAKHSNIQALYIHVDCNIAFSVHMHAHTHTHTQYSTNCVYTTRPYRNNTQSSWRILVGRRELYIVRYYAIEAIKRNSFLFNTHTAAARLQLHMKVLLTKTAHTSNITIAILGQSGGKR